MRHRNTAPLTATKITAGPTSEIESSMAAAGKKETIKEVNKNILFCVCRMWVINNRHFDGMVSWFV